MTQETANEKSDKIVLVHGAPCSVLTLRLRSSEASPKVAASPEN